MELKFMEHDVTESNEPVADDREVDNGGVGVGDAEEQGIDSNAQAHETDEPYSIKKRLGMQAKKHAREMRQLHERLEQMQSLIRQDSANPEHAYQQHYNSPGQPQGVGMSEEERIQAAVRMALGAKEHEERRAKEAERMAHVDKQYQRLHHEFDNASEKYDDFDDVVRGDDVPFTPHVRDALLLIENPADVAYRLGKNRSELERISKLHPLDQAREVNKLSFSLLNGGSTKQQSSSKSAPMGSIRANPVSASTAVTDKTPPSVIRARMKAGTWK
jgi:hypothetical protein